MEEVYELLYILGFTLGGIAACVALLLFFVLHIRQVRDDLTGKTAERAIAAIRSGRQRAWRKIDERELGDDCATIAREDGHNYEEQGVSLRHITAGGREMVLPCDDADFESTTLLGQNVPLQSRIDDKQGSLREARVTDEPESASDIDFRATTRLDTRDVP